MERERGSLSTPEEVMEEVARAEAEHAASIGRLVGALAQIERVVEERGDAALLMPVLAAQQRAFAGCKRWPDVAKCLRRSVEVSSDPFEQVRLGLELAKVCRDHLFNEAEAVKWFEVVLEIDALNTEAIEQLVLMYERRRDWKNVIRTRRRALEQIEDASEYVASLIELARECSRKVSDTGLQRELWTHVLEYDSNNAEARQYLHTPVRRGWAQRLSAWVKR